MNSALAQLERIKQDRETADARLHTETRREQFSTEAAFGGDPRPGENSPELKGHQQEKHEEREKYRADVETETHKTAMQMNKLVVDLGTQKRATGSIRKQGLEDNIHSVDAAEVATFFVYRSLCRVSESVKDEAILKLHKEMLMRCLTRTLDGLATLTVGPKLDLSRFDAEGLGQ